MLLKIIKKKGISISQLAKGIGVSYSYAWRLVHHQRRPSPEVSQRIEIFLDHEIKAVDLIFPPVKDDYFSHDSFFVKIKKLFTK